ncbi:MAG TPA: glycosyltransferase family 4 protein [Chloroflexota bacterium]|nr:glycosyltransferase family 4 protein [Chloroflexota bacterium]
MRIAFVDYVCHPDKPGTTGLSDVVWDMAGRLARLGDSVHVVAPYTVANMPDPAVHVHRFRLPPIGYRNIAGHVLIVLAAYRRLRSIGPVDVVHVPEYVSAPILAKLLRHTPVVFTEPGNIYERVAHGNPYDPITTAAFKLAARRAAASCARLVATSDEMARWWQWTGFSSERVVRIPLGIDTRLFRHLGHAKALLNFEPRNHHLVYAARLSRENGADIALNALALLRRSGRRAKLHVLGHGPERSSLTQLSRCLGISDDVIWHGWVDLGLLPAYYSAADVFLFSGRSGGTPRVLLQAMACRAPVAASEIGGIVDHVEHEHTGLLFASGRCDQLAATLERLLSDRELRLRLARNGEEYARRHVDWDVLVPRLRSEVYAPAVLACGIRQQAISG